MAFVRDDDIDSRTIRQSFLDRSEFLISNNHDTISPALGEISQTLTLIIKDKNSNALIAEPLAELLPPVVDKSDRTHNQCLLNNRRGFKDRILLEQSPKQRNSLQSLSQAHVICENGTFTIKRPHAHHTLIQEFDTLTLMRPQVLGQERINNNIHNLPPLRHRLRPRHNQCTNRLGVMTRNDLPHGLGGNVVHK